MNTELVQQEIDRIILDVNTRGWRFNRVTKKALAKIDELGLRSYITEWMTRDGAKSDAIINEIIKQAKDAGGKVITERGASFDDATTYTTKPSTLYTLLNEQEYNPMKLYTHDFYGNVETIEFQSHPEVQEWFANYDYMGHKHLYAGDIDLLAIDSDEFQKWLENPVF